jgi:predicted porin
MKATTTLAVALGLCATAYAGDTTSAPASTPPPMTDSSLWTWFVGGSAGYLIDSEEEYYTLHLGMKLAESGPVTHSIFLEGMFAEFDTGLGLETDVIPVTVNYKFDYAINDAWSFYAGLGVGAAFVDTSFGPFDDSSTELTAQIFAGIGYDVTENFQLYTGARWIWVDDSSIGAIPVDIGDDVGVELGARFRF